MGAIREWKLIVSQFSLEIRQGKKWKTLMEEVYYREDMMGLPT